MTHDQVARIAARWLRKRHTCLNVLIDMRTDLVIEQPDVIGWRGDAWSVLIEAKATRSDFQADKRKRCRRIEARHGLASVHSRGHRMGQERWYVCPAGVITVGDLPDGWGLAWVEARGRGWIVTIQKAAPNTRLKIRGFKRQDLYGFNERMKIRAAEHLYMLGALTKVRTGRVDTLTRCVLADEVKR